jgi:hypothetical protein
MILAALVAVALTVAAGCSSGDDDDAAATVDTTATATTAPETTTVAGPTPTSLIGVAARVEPVTQEQLGASWHEGCPVAPGDLRLLTIPYIGFDGQVHAGQMVVHADVAVSVVQVFRTLYDAKFPIEKMELVTEYGADDDQSTMANNTSGFNCRRITEGSEWSQHAYGKAIDIDPVQNPYVYADGHVLDPAAEPYLDRSNTDPGVIHDGDVVVDSFAAIGWGWGGDYDTRKDYQHFSKTGG